MFYLRRSTEGDYAGTCPVPQLGAGALHTEIAAAAGAGSAHRVPEVMPRDYHQIVLYLEGKRALDNIFKQ